MKKRREIERKKLRENNNNKKKVFERRVRMGWVLGSFGVGERWLRGESGDVLIAVH